ncbi:MAG TPA: hypothetical protein ENJ20_07820 [Bacteroidetes bacterium]|nr:hypothetical protein [Bacteroidota bacterium]
MACTGRLLINPSHQIVLLRGSIKIATLFGIPVLLHWSFVLLAIFGFYQAKVKGLSWWEGGWWAAFLFCVFGSILLHEFGHALMARRFGVGTREILLLPLGGLARLESHPEKPMQELLIALAGPLVNVGIAVVLFPCFWWMTKPALASRPLPSLENLDDDFFLFLPLLLFLNLLLALFNMLPAFPMDGGHLLRALLSMKTDRLTATRTAVGAGLTLAAGFILYGLASARFSYLLPGVFIALTAIREYRRIKSETRPATINDAFLRQHYPLSPRLTIREVQAVAGKTGQRGFLVFDEKGNLTGTLHLDAINSHPEGLVKSHLDKNLCLLSTQTTLEEATQQMKENNCTVAAVLENGNPVGVYWKEWEG